jgi:hypothetical protein
VAGAAPAWARAEAAPAWYRDSVKRRLARRAAPGVGGSDRASWRASVVAAVGFGAAACGPLLGIDSVERQGDETAGASGVAGSATKGTGGGGAGGTGGAGGVGGGGGSGGGGSGGSGGGLAPQGFLRFANLAGGPIGDLPDFGFDLCFRTGTEGAWQGPVLAAVGESALFNGDLTGHRGLAPGDYGLRAVPGETPCEGPTAIDFEGPFRVAVGVWATVAVVDLGLGGQALRSFFDGTPKPIDDRVEGRLANVLSGDDARIARFEPLAKDVNHLENPSVLLDPGGRLPLEAVFLDEAPFAPFGDHFVRERLGQTVFLLTTDRLTQAAGLVACTNGPGASLDQGDFGSPGCDRIELVAADFRAAD